MNRLGIKRWLSTGLVLGSIGCSDGGDPTKDAEDPGPLPGDPHIPGSSVRASLSAAVDCDDLLLRVQDDAIAKLMLEVERYKKQPVGKDGLPTPGGGLAVDAGVARPSLPTGNPSVPVDDVADAPESGKDDSSGVGGDGNSAGAPPSEGEGPVGASDTNNQVAGVDEADFVKLVDKGQFLYLLHGNTLRKLDSWPAAETKLVGEPLEIEGSPSEMFVTEGGKAVVFSSVYSYASTGGGKPVADVCGPTYCGGYGSLGLKITVADVSTDTPKVEREIFYEGSYLSSRRYGDVVRAVIQSYSKYAGLFSPQVQWYDAWGRAYDKDEIAKQLDEWQARTESSIRKTELSDWFPVAQQVVDGKLVDIAPGCDSYFVPDPGLSDYGLTHVLSLDTATPNAKIGGVTIVGAASTVYSNASQLVIAQPDYRGSRADWGVISNQQTAYHVFALDGASTRYSASGWLFGSLPANNAQFGIDIGANGTLRVATTGWVRDKPDADPSSEAFWAQHTENRVLVAKIDGNKVVLAGQSEPLGKVGETVQSARFVGDRAYVVTYRQIDPLIVLDVAGDAPKVLGELEIPGFSQYMHPLDATHLITVGQSGQGGIQLQLFDVSDPKNLPLPRTLDFGAGSSSEVSYNHKAFTSFEDLLAMPVQGQYRGLNKRAGYNSTLEVLRVSAAEGFSKLASIDHSKLYADNGAGVRCGVCEPQPAGDFACYDYSCSYQPELRRGHFVKGEDGRLYVYSISWAGVLVHALSPLEALASVGLPQPVFDGGPWYAEGGVAVRDGDIAVPPIEAMPPVATSAGAAPTP